MLDAFGGGWVAAQDPNRRPRRIPATNVILLGTTGLAKVIEIALGLSGIPLLPMILSMPISLYGLTVGMRILGLMYYTNKEKLAWFN